MKSKQTIQQSNQQTNKCRENSMLVSHDFPKCCDSSSSPKYTVLNNNCFLVFSNFTGSWIPCELYFYAYQVNLHIFTCFFGPLSLSLRISLFLILLIEFSRLFLSSSSIPFSLFSFLPSFALSLCFFLSSFPL